MIVFSVLPPTQGGINSNKSKLEENLKNKANPPPKFGDNQKENMNEDTIIFEEANLGQKMNKEINKNDNIFQNLKKKKRSIKNISKNITGGSEKNLIDKSKTLSGSLKDLKYKDQISIRRLLHDKIKNNNNIKMPESIQNFG